MEGQQVEKHPHIRASGIIDRIVLGGTDGIIESVAVTSGLNGAGLPFGAVAVAGLAFAIAGALSMFFSSYLAERSQIEILKEDIERERMEIETEPDEERRELEELLRREGYAEGEIETIMKRVTSDKELWLRTQLRLELHQHTSDVSVSPLKGAAPAGAIFFLGAFLPLLPYLVGLDRNVTFAISLVISVSTLFVLGATKFVSTKRPNLRGGLENTVIGGFAAILLYLIGHFISAI